MRPPSGEPHDRPRRRSPRGQAMLEYSAVSHYLLIGGAGTLLYFAKELYNMLSLYFEGIYFVLRSSSV
jgi:hypothetical protein